MSVKAFAVFAVVLGLTGAVGVAGAAGKPEEGVAKPGRLERLKGLDADHDGAVTAEEFSKEQRERFAKRDADKDGRLSAEELLSTRAKARANPEDRADRYIKRHDANADGKVTADEVEAGQRAWFAKRDANGDGKISSSEAPRWFSRRNGSAAVPTLQSAVDKGLKRFSAMDVNGDRVVDSIEITSGLAEQRAYRVKRAMHRLDKDRDGSVSEAEFLEQARERFFNLDLDNNGRITAEDLPPQARLDWNAR